MKTEVNKPEVLDKTEMLSIRGGEEGNGEDIRPTTPSNTSN